MTRHQEVADIGEILREWLWHRTGTEILISPRKNHFRKFADTAARGRRLTLPRCKRTFSRMQDEASAALVPTATRKPQMPTFAEQQHSATPATRSRMPKGLLIHNLKAGSLDAELLPKLVSVLGDVLSIDIERLGGSGDAVKVCRSESLSLGCRCWRRWHGRKGGLESGRHDGSFERYSREHSITLPEVSIYPSTPSRPAT